MSDRSLGSVAEHFLAQVASQPQSIALCEPSAGNIKSYTWRDIASVVDSVGQAFDAWGVKRGDHVATWLPNSLAWIAIDLAAQLRGAVHVALDARLPTATAVRLAEHACAAIFITSQAASRSSEFRSAPVTGIKLLSVEDVLTGHALSADEQTMRGARPAVRAETPAQILYTSGTMSDPKGVVLSHGNLLTNACAKLAAAPQHRGDVRLNILPFSHAYARTCELSTWIISGSRLVLARDWANLLELALAIQPTLINLVPHLVHKLVGELARAADNSEGQPAGVRVLGSRLRLLQVGGAALRRDLWDRLAAEGWPPLQGYGLTETSPVVCSNRAGDQQPDSVGRPVDGVELRLDERGVLWTRGPHVMLGYWRDPAATAAKIVDGWLCTDDLAEVTADGRLRILGRMDDQITLSTGYKASPHELSRRLADDPWVEQLVIVGQDQPHLAALVYPSFAQLPPELFLKCLASDPSEPSNNSPRELDEASFVSALAERWSAALADLPRQLRIERIGLLPEPLTSETGGLNFKGAVRRKHVEQTLLRTQVAALYNDRVTASR